MDEEEEEASITITCLLFVLAFEVHHNKDHRHAYRKKKTACSLVVVVVGVVVEKDYAYDDGPKNDLEKPIVDVMKNKNVSKRTLLNASRSMRMQKGRIPSGHSWNVVNYVERTCGRIKKKDPTTADLYVQ